MINDNIVASIKSGCNENINAESGADIYVCCDDAVTSKYVISKRPDLETFNWILRPSYIVDLGFVFRVDKQTPKRIIIEHNYYHRQYSLILNCFQTEPLINGKYTFQSRRDLKKMNFFLVAYSLIYSLICITICFLGFGAPFYSFELATVIMFLLATVVLCIYVRELYVLGKIKGIIKDNSIITKYFKIADINRINSNVVQFID